jgi:hypothetical protein
MARVFRLIREYHGDTIEQTALKTVLSKETIENLEKIPEKEFLFKIKEHMVFLSDYEDAYGICRHSIRLMIIPGFFQALAIRKLEEIISLKNENNS